MRWPWPVSSRAGDLQLLVLEVAGRCDQRCLHCDVWRAPARAGLSAEERAAVTDEAIALGVRAVLFTGGEPLTAPDLFALAARVRAAGARVLVATNGHRLAVHAEGVTALVDELYVSLDGPGAAGHDAVRGPGSHEALARGLLAVRSRPRRPRLVARCTLHALNLAGFPGVVEDARALGFDAVSFLPLDASSEAFGGRPAERARLVPRHVELEAFESAVDRLERGGWPEGFLRERPDDLRRMARHLRASGGTAPFEAPRCDAPWWSSVVAFDGAVRPCFFQPVVGSVRDGLGPVRSSAAYVAALDRVRRANPTCAACVCPKKGAPA